MAIRACVLALLLSTPFLSPHPAHGETYPSRPIKMIVPFPAGGPSDAMARLVADRLSSALAQTVVVENRAGGAGGSVGAKAVATAEPDGYTLLLSPPGPFSIAPAVYKKLDYDPIKDFAPVAMLIAAPLVLVVGPALPVGSLTELIEYAKRNPGKISQATQGYGTAPHLFGEMLKMETGIEIVLVPYRGTAPALTDLMAGQVQMFFDTTTALLPHIQAGKLRPLAVTSATRSVRLPEVPTTTEAGFPKLTSLFWLGLAAPAGTPASVITKLNAAINESFRNDDMRSRFAELGAELMLGSPQDFAAYIAEEIKRWTAVTTAAGIKID